MRILQERFHENRQYLIEYSLKMDYIFDKTVESKEERIKEAVMKQKKNGDFRKELGENM